MPKSIADTLMERRAKLIQDAQAIAQQGVAEDRDLSADEQARFDQMYAEAEKLHERAKAIRKGEEDARDLEESFRQQQGREPHRGAHRQEGVEGGLGEWVRSARPGEGYDLAAVKGAALRAQQRILAGPEVRALSATGGVDQDGVYGQLWEYAVEASQVLQAGVDVINTSDGNTMPFPRATAHSELQTATANTALTQDDSTLDTVDLSVSKYGFLTLVPTELVQDATFDVEGYISRNAGRQLGRKVGAVASAAIISSFTTAGKTGPVGTSTSLGSQDTEGEGSDLLVDLFHSVLPEYRTNASWLMNDAMIATVRKLKTSTGEPVWERALTQGNPGGVLDKTVYADPNLPTPAADAKTIYFGDFSALKVRVAGGMRFERSNDYAFDADQIAFRVIVRAGAVGLDPNAVKYFAHSST